MKALNQSLYTVLAADVASGASGSLGDLGVTSAEHKVAPEGTSYPVLVYQKQAGADVYTLGKHRAWRPFTYLVKVIQTGHTDETAQDAIARVDALLTDTALAVTGYTTMLIERMSDVEYAEVDNGITYHHVGALFTIWLAPS